MREANEVLAQRYVVLRTVARGGTGAVYRARDERDLREVAIKEIFGQETDGETVLARRTFMAEVELLARLQHPRIPSVWDAFVDGSSGFIVMELIEGESLAAVTADYKALTGAPVPHHLVVEYAIQVCDILRYLHMQPGKPIVHRDVKPGNIILRKNRSEVVLVDFGLARGLNPNTLSTVTSAGTLGYAPAEQLAGEAEPRSDIYGVGATMYFLLKGRHPVPLKVCSPRNLPGVLPELAAVVEKATQQEPEDRFTSAHEMSRALQRLQVI